MKRDTILQGNLSCAAIDAESDTYAVWLPRRTTFTTRRWRMVWLWVRHAVNANNGCCDAGGRVQRDCWSLLVDPAHREDIIQDGWKDIGKVFSLALVLDMIYQIMEL